MRSPSELLDLAYGDRRSAEERAAWQALGWRERRRASGAVRRGEAITDPLTARLIVAIAQRVEARTPSPSQRAIAWALILVGFPAFALYEAQQGAWIAAALAGAVVPYGVAQLIRSRASASRAARARELSAAYASPPTASPTEPEELDRGLLAVALGTAFALQTTAYVVLRGAEGTWPPDWGGAMSFGLGATLALYFLRFRRVEGTQPSAGLTGPGPHFRRPSESG